jgi:hypothetical protein
MALKLKTIKSQMFIQVSPRTLSLTSIMSTSGNPSLPPSTAEAMAVLMQSAPHPIQDENGFLDCSLRSARVLGSRGFAFDEAVRRAQATFLACGCI